VRSNLVFAAAVQTPNRYLLCRILSVSARRVNRGNEPFAKGINEVLCIAGEEREAGIPQATAFEALDRVARQVVVGRRA
jgi:hypothetical protein